MSVPKTIPLVIAYGEKAYEQTKALIDGTVQIENCRTTFVPLAPGEMLVRSFEDPEFNVAELSLSNYVIRRARGNCPYVAIPAYVSRSFRHADLYVRTDRNIRTPQALRGRRVGIAEYQHTAYVWARAILEDEYGVRPSDVKWVVASADAHDHSDAPAFQPPPGVVIERLHSAKTLSEMLEDGEIDALISPQVPSCHARGAPHIARLFADHRAVEDDYFRRTGIFPILHVMGIRNELVKSHPGLAENVFRAFLAAKDLALASKIEAAALPSAPPSLASEVARMTRLMGEDQYSYGVNERDCKTLDVFLRYHFKQGLSDRRLDVAELFSPVPISHYKT